MTQWNYELLRGKNTMLKRLVDGDWNEEEFLIVPPGKQAVQSYDEDIIKVEEA